MGRHAAVRPHSTVFLREEGNLEFANPLVTNESSSLLQVILGGVLVLQGVSLFAAGMSLPVAEIGGVLFLLLALFKKPKRQLSKFGVLNILAVALVLFLIGSTLINDGMWFRRSFRIAVLIGLIGVFASGRLNLRAALQGATAVLAINIPLFYLGLVSDTYGGVLTGLLGDKNVAGLYYAVIPVLLAATYQERRIRIPLVVFAVFGTVLTDSRTSMAGLGCAIVWLLVARRLGLFFRFVLLGVLVGIVQYLEENFAQALVFADRVGSDRLRAEIDALSWAKVTVAPWYGHGLNEAKVLIEDREWWFHNSYYALWAEGGWIFLVVVVLAYVLLGLRPFSTMDRTRSRIGVEAAAITLLVCATRLGEVFITLPGVLVLAAGLTLTAEEIRLKQLRDYNARLERTRALKATSNY